MPYDFDEAIERRGSWSTRWERYPGDVIPLWVADTDFRAPPAVLEAIARRAAHGVFGYCTPPAELRDAVIERMQRLYGWRVEPEWVVFVSGVVPGLHLAARHLMRPDQHALVPVPVYHHLKRAPEVAQRAFSEVPLILSQGRWVWDEDCLASAVKPDSRLLFLCNPQNPGGTIFTRAELSRLAAFAGKHDLVICSDEIHADLLLDQGKPHVPIASLSREASRRTVTLISPNKAFGFPGAGCAFAIIEDTALRRAFSADHHATVHDASVFGYEAALAAYRECGEWLAAQLAYLRANRDLVEREIGATPGLRMAHVEATYLAWIDASGLGVADPHRHFLDHGVALSPGSQFGDAKFVRLNFGTRRQLLVQALERISSASRLRPRG
ncbi:MAG TPA: PatB family C-S lyase [Burkholderiales bacterium]|nr:PatB family C-S lyase [Burkholderiales bacterium]